MKRTTRKLHNEDSQAPFEPIAKTLLKERGVTEGKMFGTSCVKIKGKIFAFYWKGRMVFKLPADCVAEIIASKKGIPFDPGHGRISKEWVAVASNAQSQWLSLARDAKDFVATGPR